MSFDDVLLELYRLAESRAWDGKRSDEAMITAIEAMEQIWLLRQEEQRRIAKATANGRQPRLWS